MKDVKILYEIKSLEKMIARELIKENDLKKQKKIIITPTQCQIIGYILNNKGKNIYQKDLEKALSLRRATVSGVLHTMEKNGFIEREIDEDDTRAKKITIKEEILKRFDDNYEKIENIEKNIIKDITEEDLKTFINVLNQMKKNIKQKEGI